MVCTVQHRCIIALLLSAATACAPVSLWRSAPEVIPPSKPPVAALAWIGDVPLSPTDLPESTAARLTDLDNDYAQRRYHLLWAGVEDAVAERLLQMEAQQRGTTVAELLQLEVDGKVGSPSDAELHDLYDDNRTVIGLSFEAAASDLKNQWRDDRIKQLRRALVDGLRASHPVRYNLPPPALPRYVVDSGDGPSRGPRQAPITIVEFSDFKCPYCAQARRLLERITEMYPSEVRVVHRDYPLSQHQGARLAAQAAQCAQEQDKFWPYHDLLFEHNNALERADLQRYATAAELDINAFTHCLDSERPGKAVAADVQAAKRAGVQGTPAIFVNGMRLRGVLPLPLMQAIIDRELQTQ